MSETLLAELTFMNPNKQNQEKMSNNEEKQSVALDLHSGEHTGRVMSINVDI